MRIYITANSPGEVAGWVQPLVDEIIARAPNSEIMMVLLPCQYASGSEMSLGSRMKGISEVISFRQLLWQLISKRQTLLQEGQRGIIFFLGGDPFYAALLGKLTQFPVLGYMPRPRKQKYFTHFFLPDNAAYERAVAAGIAKNKMTVVGHLALDSIGSLRSRDELRAEMGYSKDDVIITMLPGSRPKYVEYMLPFFLGVVAKLQLQLSCRVLLAISPFINTQQVRNILLAEGSHFHEEANEFHLGSHNNCRIIFDNPRDAMMIADLALTIPGTNNMQLAGMGIPFVMVVPLNKAEDIPLDGLIGLLNPHIFPIGYLKRKLIYKMNQRIPFISWPNMIAGREIVPEMRGVLTVEGVCKVLVELLADKLLREQISRDLLKITDTRGAASIMASEILVSQNG